MSQGIAASLEQVATALAARASGHSTRQAAAIAGVAEPSVRRWEAGTNGVTKGLDVEQFAALVAQKQREGALEWVEIGEITAAEMLRRLKQPDLAAGIPFRDLVVAKGVGFDKVQVALGQPTTIVEHRADIPRSAEESAALDVLTEVLARRMGAVDAEYAELPSDATSAEGNVGQPGADEGENGS